MIKTFEELRSHIWGERQNMLEIMAEVLEDSTKFRRGVLVGRIEAYDDVLATLRTSLKYSEPEELKEVPAPW